MYIFIGIFILICFVFLCLQLYRRKRIICRVRQMDACVKVCMLNDILDSFGFYYEKKQDIIASKQDAWQRQFGYCSLFDRSAVHFGMVFDCEPIYFYCRRRTYRIELWKGQYGINVGAEAGIYYAEGIIPPWKFDSTRFQSVSDKDMPMMKIALYQKGQKIFENAGRHWWLTGFDMGKYCEPDDLMLRVSITFEDQNMVSCFVKSLLHLGYQECDIIVCDRKVCFSFSFTHCWQPRCKKRCCAAWAQWKNRIFVKLFVWITKPFFCTLDRLMYLYFFLPYVFRRICLCRKSRRQKQHKRKKHCRKNRCWEQDRTEEYYCGGQHPERHCCESGHEMYDGDNCRSQDLPPKDEGTEENNGDRDGNAE